jgi:hypothetical protein
MKIFFLAFVGLGLTSWPMAVLAWPAPHAPPCSRSALGPAHSRRPLHARDAPARARPRSDRARTRPRSDRLRPAFKAPLSEPLSPLSLSRPLALPFQNPEREPLPRHRTGARRCRSGHHRSPSADWSRLRLRLPLKHPVLAAVLPFKPR